PSSGRVDAEDPIRLLRPRERLVEALAPPVADLRHALRLREPHLAAEELLPRPAALRDVLDLADEVERLAPARAHERDAEQHPDDVPVPMEVAFLHLVRPDLPGEHLLDVGEVGIEI